jgi:hypothetical protein
VSLRSRPRARCALRQEVAHAHLSNRSSLSTAPIAQLAVLRTVDEHHRTVYDPADLMAIFAVDEVRAVALLSRLTLLQLAEQAAAHVAWLANYGLAGGTIELLAHWLTVIATHLARFGDD